MTGPRDYTEHVILQVFRSVLGQPELSLHADFLVAGGNSVHAVVAARRLSRRLGDAVTPAMIYRAPTAAQLAVQVRRPAADAPCELVPLHDPDDVSEDLLPIVMIPGISGDIAYAHGVIAATPGRQMFGIQPLAAPKPAPDPDWTFESIGELYAGLLAEQLPGRRIVLAGHSFGGCLALETAVRLTALGGNPDPVVVFVAPPAFGTQSVVTVEALLKEMLGFTAPIGVPPEEAPRRYRELTEGRAQEELWRAVCDEYVRVEWVPQYDADAVIRLQVAYRLANMQALERYRPQRECDLDVLLLLSDDEPDDPISGTPLEKVLRKWRSRRVAGAHALLFNEPWVSGIGRELATAEIEP